MQGIDEEGWASQNNLSAMKAMNVAFLIALAMHVLLLFVKTDFFKPNNGLSIISSERPILVEMQVDHETKTPEKLIEEAPSAEPSEVEPVAAEKARQTPTISQPDILTVNANEETQQEQRISIPSFDSQEFKAFLESEIQNNLANNPNGLGEFADTFVVPVAPKIKNTKRETGSLGGGLYKVRRNGYECNTLVMTPQTFDQMVGGTISTSGECKELKKKFNLLDENGRIRNSDRGS